MSNDTLTGLNINKGGVDPPLKPDDQYPDWLWKLSSSGKTLAELNRADDDSLDFDDVRLVLCCFLYHPPSSLSPTPACFLHSFMQLKRWQKLTNRDKIRTSNMNKGR